MLPLELRPHAQLYVTGDGYPYYDLRQLVKSALLLDVVTRYCWKPLPESLNVVLADVVLLLIFVPAVILNNKWSSKEVASLAMIASSRTLSYRTHSPSSHFP